MLTSAMPRITALCVTTDEQIAVAGYSDGVIKLYDLSSRQTLTPDNGCYLATASAPVTVIAATRCDNDLLVFFGSENKKFGAYKVGIFVAEGIRLGGVAPIKKESPCLNIAGISIMESTNDHTVIVVAYTNAMFQKIEFARDLTWKLIGESKLPIYTSDVPIVSVSTLPYYNTICMRHRYYFFVLTEAKKLVAFACGEKLGSWPIAKCLCDSNTQGAAKTAMSSCGCGYMLYIIQDRAYYLNVADLMPKLITTDSSSSGSSSIVDSEIIVACPENVYTIKEGRLHVWPLSKLIPAGPGPSPLSLPSGSSSSSSGRY